MRTPLCPLCLSCSSSELLVKNGGQVYWDCDACGLIFLSEEHHLTADDERTHYLTHNNDVTDPRYRQFVSPLVDFIHWRVPAGAEGLDFGAGPGPVASVMLQERGLETTLYDPYFGSDPEALEKSYDFVFASEVIEHFRRPRDELMRIKSLLRPGGIFFAMTEIFRDELPFSAWYYHRDPTHVVFYRPRTFEKIQMMLGFSGLEYSGARLIALFT